MNVTVAAHPGAILKDYRDGTLRWSRTDIAERHDRVFYLAK
jgi:hypothetical protein